jgi:Protein of unknown function (DUF4232)
VKGIGVAALTLVGLALAGPAQPESTLRTCSTAQLHIWVTHTFAGLGTVGGYLAFTNRTEAECSLHGWPTLTALRPGASSTAVRVRTTMVGPYAVRGVPTVRLRHGQTAVAAFAAGDNPGPGQTTCPPSYRRLRVTPPGDTKSALVKAWIWYLGHNLPSCTRIEVSMVVPASDMPPRG